MHSPILSRRFLGFSANNNMANTGLPLPNPPGGGSSLAPVGKKGQLDLDSVLPFLLLLSPLLESKNPGSGMGLAAGITAYQQGKQQKRHQGQPAKVGC